PIIHLAKEKVRIAKSASGKRRLSGKHSAKVKVPGIDVSPRGVIVLVGQQLCTKMKDVSAPDQSNRVGRVDAVFGVSGTHLVARRTDVGSANRTADGNA